MKQSVIVCVMMALVIMASVFATANVAGFETETNVSGTDVTPTNVLACGDLNGDTKIDAKDALVVLKACVQKITLNDVQAEAADTYQDGVVNAKDALYILRYAVEKESVLPVIPEVVTDTDVTPTQR